MLDGEMQLSLEMLCIGNGCWRARWDAGWRAGSAYVLLVLLELRDRSLGVSQWDWPDGLELDFNTPSQEEIV